MMRRALLATAIVAATACVTVDGDVLVDGTQLTTCADVERRMSDLQACSFTGLCAVPDATDPSCCQLIASCDDGTLALERYCAPGCAPCMDDSGCRFGEQLCDDQQCAACPDVSACPPCEVGFAPLSRNGCPTCTCAPASECTADPTTACTDEQCYPGLVCAPGCVAGDPGCCANVCAAAGCPSPAPLGCDTDCTTAPMCQTCVTVACECDQGRWICRADCGTPTGACFQPT